VSRGLDGMGSLDCVRRMATVIVGLPHVPFSAHREIRNRPQAVGECDLAAGKGAGDASQFLGKHSAEGLRGGAPQCAVIGERGAAEIDLLQVVLIDLAGDLETNEDPLISVREGA
jgi:hypothetical protein